MGTEKGLFRDKDKFTDRHNELTKAFGDQGFVYDFLWEYLRIAPKEFNIELEKPIKSKSGFLYGFADCYIKVLDIFNNKFNLLIEFKSSLNDYASTLRQIKTYIDYLDKIDYTFLIINNNENNFDDRFEFTKEFQDLFRLFFTQKIILIDYFDMIHTFGSIDHKYANLSQKEKEDINLIINAPIFLGEWQGVLESFDKSSLENNAEKTYVSVSKILTDPKYKIKTKISDIYPIPSNELRKLLDVYQNNEIYFDPPIKCKVKVTLIEDSDFRIQQCITGLEIDGKNY